MHSAHYSARMNSTFDPAENSRCSTQRSQVSAHSQSPSLVLQAAEDLIQSMESMPGRRGVSREQLLVCPPRSTGSRAHQQRTASHGMTFYEDRTYVPAFNFGNSNHTSIAGSPKSITQESPSQRKHLRSLQDGAPYASSSQNESKKQSSRQISSSFCGATDSEIISLDGAKGQSILNEIDKLCRHVLPSFDFKKAGLEASSSSSPSRACPDYYKSVIQRLLLLRMTIDAKTETMAVIRTKMKQEMDCLRAEVERVHTEKSRESSKSREIESLHQQDVTDLSGQLEQQRQAHELQMSRLSYQVQASEAAQQELKEQLAAAVERISEVTKVSTEKGAEVERLMGEMGEHKELESSLASETCELKRTVAALRGELEHTRLAQKFMGGRVEAGSKVKDTELELMRKCESLLSQLAKLKKTNAELSAEAAAAARQRVAAAAEQRVTERAVTMVVADKVADEQLTATILRRNMCAAANASPAPAPLPRHPSDHQPPAPAPRDTSTAAPSAPPSLHLSRLPHPLHHDNRHAPAAPPERDSPLLSRSPSVPSERERGAQSASVSPSRDSEAGGGWMGCESEAVSVSCDDDEFIARLKQRFGRLH